MAVVRVYEDGQWVPVGSGSPELVSHSLLEYELSHKSDIEHNHGPVGQVPGGFQQMAANYVYGGGDVQILSGFTIAGDGLTPIKIIFQSSYIEVAAGTGVHFYVRRDGGALLTVGASGNGGAIPGGYPWTSVYGETVVAPFTGTKSFTVNMATTSGAGCTVYGTTGAVGYQTYIRAEWAPGHTNNI